MKKTALLCLLILNSGYLFAQQVNTARYRIVQMPVEIERAKPNIKASLNKKIQGVPGKQQVFTILNDSLRSFKNLPVKIREQVSSSGFQYYTYNISAPTESSLKFIDIKGSRDIESETICYHDDFKKFFMDTLVILDSLKMTINPKDFTYKISDYFILASGSDGALKKIRLPFRNNNIFLAEKDFRSFAPGYINCSLFNTAAPGKAIAVFRAIFPDADEKSLLKDMALSLKEENAGNNEFNDHQIALHLAAYLKATYGTIKESNLLSWIQSNL